MNKNECENPQSLGDTKNIKTITFLKHNKNHEYKK